jgi:hypothetical protein
MRSIVKSDIIKTFAAVFLFALVMCALAIAVYDKIIGLAVDPLINSILVAAITTSLGLVGVHTGVTVANGVATNAVAASVEANKASTAAAVEASIKTISATQQQQVGNTGGGETRIV